MYPNILSELDAGIGTITLNRSEKRNALNRELLIELDAALTHMGQATDLRVLVLKAAGEVFCAGMDLQEMQQRAASPNAHREWEIDSQLLCEVLIKLIELPVPVLAQVPGPVIAGGLGLVLACDLIVASPQAWFRLPEPRRGIVAAMVTPLLIYRVGPGIAGQMLLTGSIFNAARAHQVGLCFEVVPPEQMEATVHQIVGDVLANSPMAIKLTKQHLYHTGQPDLVSQLRQSMHLSAEARQQADAREGLQAFLEKREPSWMVNRKGD